VVYFSLRGFSSLLWLPPLGFFASCGAAVCAVPAPLCTPLFFFLFLWVCFRFLFRAAWPCCVSAPFLVPPLFIYGCRDCVLAVLQSTLCASPFTCCIFPRLLFQSPISLLFPFQVAHSDAHCGWQVFFSRTFSQVIPLGGCYPLFSLCHLLYSPVDPASCSFCVPMSPRS